MSGTHFGIGIVPAPKQGKLVEYYDTTGRSFTNSWGVGATFGNETFQGGSRLRIFLYVPCRNDSENWGGLFTELQYSFDNGASWSSLGNSGYGAVMTYRARAIATYSNCFLWDPGREDDFTCRFRLRHRSYTDTTHVNQHTVAYGDRFRTHLQIEEILS